MMSLLFLMLWWCTHKGRSVVDVIEGCLLYFVVQSLGSLVILMGFTSVGILVKLGVMPFHLWSIVVLPRMCDTCLILFTTVQKVPLVMMLDVMSTWVIGVLLVSAFLSSIGSFGSTTKGTLLAWSGVCNTTLMSLVSQHSESLLFLYVVFYVIALVHFLNEGGVLGCIHLAGVPPYPLFWVKLFLILSLAPLCVSVLLVSSVLLFLAYITFHK
uniref:NADH dehydrogenase subunit II n=1 Tax=Dicyema misakiense TaxID=10218 RepID=Q9T9L1_9BILA|nr:NADH dehydrogenase subunit II [Dicyema misakiense]